MDCQRLGISARPRMLSVRKRVAAATAASMNADEFVNEASISPIGIGISTIVLIWNCSSGFATVLVSR